jgi:hypothetical protein
LASGSGPGHGQRLVGGGQGVEVPDEIE